jgi:hypothetical protein
LVLTPQEDYVERLDRPGEQYLGQAVLGHLWTRVETEPRLRRDRAEDWIIKRRNREK